MNVTPDKFSEVMARLSQCDTWVVDTETSGLSPFGRKDIDKSNGQLFLGMPQFEESSKDQVIGVSIRAAGQSYYFPVRHQQGNLEDLQAQALFYEIGRVKTQIGFNYKFDTHFMYNEGTPYPKNCKDVMLAAHLMNENEDSFSLENLANKYLDSEHTVEQRRLKDKLMFHGLMKSEMWKMPPEQVAPYACEDVDLTEALHDFYEPHLKTWGLDKVWEGVNDFLIATMYMEREGILLDFPLMQDYSREADFETERLKKEIWKLAHKPINLNSSKQLQKWLGLHSTAADILEDMIDRPGVQQLLDYRHWEKANANYYRKFARVANNGRIHLSLFLAGTGTGRLSCKDPPMQAIPRETKIYKVKDVMIADKGYELVEADYSQAEIRVGTFRAKESNMAEKIMRGADIHTETANEIAIDRDHAKRLNFSVIYGIGAETLSERLKIPEEKAKVYLRRYHKNYPGFKRLYRLAEQRAEMKGYIRMHTGRLRHYNCSKAPSHKASSNLIQGDVAEMIRTSITRMHQEFGLRMKLTVHDSILFLVKQGEAHAVLPEVKRIMEDQPWCTIPQKVDFKKGPSWGKMRKVEL